jgi:hypothetical protein
MLCLFAAAPVLADPSAATNGGGYDGGTVSYTTSPYGGLNGGGEFTVGGPGFTLPVSQYDPRTRNQTGGNVSAPSIQTFCTEMDEYIGTMNIWVSTEFVDGTPGSHAYGGGKNTNSGDDLDFMTAWLYEQFATAQLDNYDFDNVKGERKSDAAGLQWAIWYIEDELDNLSYGKAQDYWDMAFAAKPTSIGNVRILQAYVGDCYKQDQLYYVPVPGAVLLGMLGLSAAGLKLRRFA